MYPFCTNEVFVRNAWYVGCSVDEITSGPLARIIMDKPVVFYRGESGTVMAMHGICPHRNYPLALKGTVKGDALQCHYHGFAFDGKSGACVLVPSQDKAPGSFRQPIYKVVERGPWVWIWPGNPDLADENEIPALDELGLGEGWKYLEPINFVGVKGRYMLLIENLFDLTHVAFLHGDMGDFDMMTKAPIKVDEGGERLTAVRPMVTQWDQTHEVMFGKENAFDGVCESASVTTFHGPGYITTTGHIISKIEGIETIDKTVYGDVYYHHAITPETRNSCHYFGMSSRTHRLDDPEFDAMFTPFDEAVRRQDVVAAEAIEAGFLQFGEPTVELMVKSDRAAGVARRLMQRLIDRER
tara:strand:+ start:4819 stop:5883 length:1065 start_codon:yes stop_codon:yes gene_type:complete